MWTKKKQSDPSLSIYHYLTYGAGVGARGQFVLDPEGVGGCGEAV